jgi:tRNA A-37 threonylcarbamoyl transferase component Bud32
VSTAADEVEKMTPPGAAPGDLRTTIAGRYELDLVAPIADGSISLVYRGKDLRTRRDVAVKTLRFEYRHDPETRARFRREARLLAFLAHPNVVRVFDFVEDRGASWVVLEYLGGRGLHAVVAAQGPLPPVVVAPLLDQAAAALGHLHARGLVHLDVKPANLLLTDDGTLKLIDFGFAQPAGRPQETIPGRGDATAGLAPEQASGEPVEATTDVYALGCVVYELLTGQPPFAAESRDGVTNDAIRARIARGPAPPTRLRPDLQLPAWVDQVVLWAMARDPAARYGGVESFAAVFRTSLGDEEPADEVIADPRRPVLITTQPHVVARGGVSRAAVTVPARLSPRRPDLGARLSQAGGRLARRSRALPPLLWRAVAAVAVLDLLVALFLLTTRGMLPGLYEPVATLHPGATARVHADALLVRDAAGTGGSPVGQLDAGTRVALTGPAQSADGTAWWPIAAERDGTPIAGFAAADWLRPQLDTPLDRLREWLPGGD